MTQFSISLHPEQQLGGGAQGCSGEMKASSPGFSPHRVTLPPGRKQNVPWFVKHVSEGSVTPLFCLNRKHGEGGFSTRATLSFIDAFPSELLKPESGFRR